MTVSKLAKSLKKSKNSILLLNISTPLQVLNGYWWSPLIPNTTNFLIKKMISIERLVSILQNYKVMVKIPINNNILMGYYYYDIYGVWEKKWRDADSTRSLMSNDSLVKCQNKISKLINNNKLNPFIHSRKEKRLQFGQTSFIIIRI